MWLKKVLLLLALIASLHQQAATIKANAQNATTIKPPVNTTLAPSFQQSSTPAAEALETAPSITSVHQVWTSSSSGSLDELSPEVIGKLRQDVPFLAAYALRPRLVGAVPTTTTVLPQTRQQLEAGSQKLDTSSSNGAPLIVQSVKGGPARTSARQVASSSLFPKLGDFSEFNVETSSTSKSEHHHKRKTSLKRQKNGNKSSSQEDRRFGIGSSQLVKKKRAKAVGGGRNGSAKSGKRSLSRRNTKRRSQVRASNRLKQAKSKKLSIVKNGRYFQEGSIETKPGSNELDLEMRSLGRDTTTLMMDDGKTNVAADESGVKGGTPREGGKKTPFYASKRPEPQAADKPDENSDEDSLSSGRKRGPSSDGTTSTTDSSTNRVDGMLDEGGDEEVGDLDGDEPEPKRVGEPDVEEDGDTVLVEPKSDGVDDDPPLPSEDPAASPDSDSSDGTDGADDSNGANGASSASDGDSSPRLADEGDPRGNRNGRDRPNLPPARGDDGAGDIGDANGGAGQVAGGGVGTTIGANGGASGTGSDDDDDSLAGGNAGRDSPSSTGSPMVGEKKFTESGVEFADEEAARDGRAGGRGAVDSASHNGAAGPDSRGPDLGSSNRDEGGEFGDRRKTATMRPRGSGERGPEMDEDDLDYRDEMTESNRNGGKKNSDGGRKDGDDDHDHHDGRTSGTDKPAHTGGHSSSGLSPSSAGSQGQHCDDGSYNHHDDHHGDGHHHSHHDTIDWLRGAIPGEPDADYPILSRVNGTNFKCSEQQHPGYYADVESRCQIFHICQADGRQDSFLQHSKKKA